MKALRFQMHALRYLMLRALVPRARGLGRLPAVLPVRLCDVPPPRLPGEEWVRVRPRLSGVCGSDLSAVFARGSAYLAPLTSMPFVPGHETVGIVTERAARAAGVNVGDRVVLRPALGCRVRGIDPPCGACASGCDALCRNVTRGVIAPGIQTGFCRDTGGGWSEGFVAHASQVYRVPEGVSDSAAVLTEPLACAVHAALRAAPGRDTAFVLGCGSIGLLTIAALRATDRVRRIVACAKYAHQARLASSLGADQVVGARGSAADRYAEWAAALDAEVIRAPLGKPTVLGGADVTFDCVASSKSIDDAVRFTRGGGQLVLVGMPGVPRHVDWTPLWYKELTVRAAYAYGREHVDGRPVDTFELALTHLRTWGDRLAPLVGTPFALEDYRAALPAALNAGGGGTVKTVFEIHA